MPAVSPWPLPSRWVDHVTLGSRRLTALYWAGVSLVVSGLFVTKLLPCVDYPQHLALSDIARRLQDPAAPEHGAYQLNYFTYNGLFHLVVARLSAVLPIEVAGRLVVAGSLLAMAGAVTALVRVLRRPPALFHLFWRRRNLLHRRQRQSRRIWFHSWHGHCSAVDQSGAVVIAGSTTASKLPVTPGALAGSCSCSYRTYAGFISKFQPAAAAQLR